MLGSGFQTGARRELGSHLGLGLTALALLAVVALSAPWLAGDASPLIPHAPERSDLSATREAPSAAHWLGTDRLGRDLAARLIHGTRVSLAVGLLTALIGVSLGIAIGAASGFWGGWVDRVGGALTEALLCFPTLLLVLAILHGGPPWIGELPATLRIALILGVAASPSIARFARAECLRLKRSLYVEAAQVAGAAPERVIRLHLLPGTIAPVSVAGAFTVAGAIGMEAALSFLGLGVPPPAISWGALLAEAQGDPAWWLTIFPGCALFIAILASNLVGEGLRRRVAGRAR